MTVFLTADDIDAVLADVDVVAEVERVHADLGSGAMEQTAPVALASSTDDAVFLPMTARSDRLGLVAVKLMGDLPDNAAYGLPSQRSTILVTSIATGGCVAVLDGAAITRARTAAASLVATKHLARPDSATFGFVGAGALAVQHAIDFDRAFTIDRMLVWSRSASTGSDFLDAVGPRIAAKTTIVHTPRDVVEGSDVVTTLTPSVSPIIEGVWLRPGQHVNAVGARPRADHREVDGSAIARSTVVVDNVATAMRKSGDLLEAIRDGSVPDDIPLQELGGVIVGAAPGRTSADEITLFDSVGIAAQDLAVAAAVIEHARARGLGSDVGLSRAPVFLPAGVA